MMHSFINIRWKKILKTIYVDREIKKICRGCVDESRFLYLCITAFGHYSIMQKKNTCKISAYFMIEEKQAG